MTPKLLIVYAPLLAMLCVAAAIDLRQRRIPNWLTLALALMGLAQSFLPHATLQPRAAILGLLVGFGLGLLLMLLGAIFGGDLKLLAAIGAWVGVTNTLWVAAIATVLGMLIALVSAIASGRARALLTNTAVMAATLVHARKLERTPGASREFASCGTPLPFAVPLAIATALAVLVLPSLRQVV